MYKILAAPFNNKKNQGGFSLVELMIVVGIIGILATFAIPRFERFQAKARMAEAKNTLSHIYTLQEAYKLDAQAYRGVANSGFGQCASMPAGAREIGLEFVPCDPVRKLPRYSYRVNVNSGTSFRAIANSLTGADNTVCPGDTTAHYWAIDHNRTTIFSTAAITGNGALTATATNQVGRCN